MDPLAHGAIGASRRAARAEFAVRRALDDARVTPTVEHTRCAGDGERAAFELAPSHDRLFVLGGEEPIDRRQCPFQHVPRVRLVHADHFLRARTRGRPAREHARSRKAREHRHQRRAARGGLEFDMMDTSFFLSRERIIATTSANIPIRSPRVFIISRLL